MERTKGRGFHTLPARSISQRITNRVLNIVVAAMLLALTGPLLVVIAIAIRWESSGPVLHRRASINRDGRRFDALSFRTTEYVEARVRSGRSVTRVGSFLLYTRMISLPQLINVFQGDITLSEMEDYSYSFWS